MLLNATALRNRVAELGLRQWWLAEQLGVDRRTVLRWINGQVRSITPERARDLAQVLACRIEDLLMHEPGRGLASAHAHRAQAQARSGQYGRGLAFAPLLLALIAARRGRVDEARANLAASQAAFAHLQLDESVNHRLAAEIWRRLGQTAAARQAAQTAFARAEGFPLERVAAEAELARVEAMAMSPAVTLQNGDTPLR